MLEGLLTPLLSKESRDKGYTIGEDEDFLYLYKNGKLVKTFHARTATIENVEKAIKLEVN